MFTTFLGFRTSGLAIRGLGTKRKFPPQSPPLVIDTHGSVYHLVALRRTLSELDLSLNAAIDDDVAPALLGLHKLTFVSLFDTGVRMPGLRRLAVSDVMLSIEAPRECEEYLEGTSRYFPRQKRRADWFYRYAPTIHAAPRTATDHGPRRMRRALGRSAAAKSRCAC